MTLPAPLTAMLADDESYVRLFLKTMLSSLGFRVVATATNGGETVALYRVHRPDVLFLDINMPLMTGREALEMIRKEFPDAFVIMLTSVTGEAEVEASLDAGAANYLRKDLPLAELKQEIVETCVEHFSGKTARGGQP